MAASDQQLYAVKGVAYRISGFMFDNTGAIIVGGLSTLAGTVSKDNGSFASTTNAATEAPANSGFFYIDLTATEMTANGVGIKVSCTNTNANVQAFVVITYDSANAVALLSNVVAWLGTTVPTPVASGYPLVDVTKWLGNTVPTPSTNGVPNVDVVNIKGAASTGDPGYVGTDQSKITNVTATVSLSGTTIGVVTAANTTKFAGQTITAAAGVTIPSTIASPTNITAGTITTVTNLTNLPSIPSNWITAAGIAAAALNGKGDWSTVTPTNLTGAQIATAIWQDTTAGDFTTASSIGKALYLNAIPGAAGGHMIAGSNAATTFATLTLTSGTIPVDVQTIKTQTVNASGTIIFATGTVSTLTAANVWDLATSGHTTAGTFGAGLVAATAPTVLEIDAQLSNTHGSGQWGSSSGSGAFLVTVTVTDNMAALVPNANVRVSNNTEGTFVSQTNSSGVASFSLNAAVFDITITKPQTQFTPATITVTTSANFPETIQLVAIPAPPAGGLICNVYGNLSSLSSGIPSGVQIKFQLSVPSAQSGFILLNDPIIGQISHGHLVGPSGQAYVPLYRNDGITPAATTYLVTCAALGLTNKPMTLAAPTFDLAQLIPP